MIKVNLRDLEDPTNRFISVSTTLYREKAYAVACRRSGLTGLVWVAVGHLGGICGGDRLELLMQTQNGGLEGCFLEILPKLEAA